MYTYLATFQTFKYPTLRDQSFLRCYKRLFYFQERAKLAIRIDEYLAVIQPYNLSCSFATFSISRWSSLLFRSCGYSPHQQFVGLKKTGGQLGSCSETTFYLKATPLLAINYIQQLFKQHKTYCLRKNHQKLYCFVLVSWTIRYYVQSIIISSAMDDIQASTIRPIHHDSVKGSFVKEQQSHINKKAQAEKIVHHVDKGKLQFGFEESALYESGHQLPAYLSLIKYLAILMVLLSICFTLPLSLIINNNKSSNSSISDDSFIFGLSIFPIITFNALDLLIYLAIPLYAIHMLILILLSLKLKQIETDINQKGQFPTNYALLLRFPASPLAETDICKQIQSWFATQMRLNKQFFEVFPELIDSIDKDHSQLSSVFSAKNSKLIDSAFIQSILLSYNYEDYIKLRQEVEYLTSCIKQESANLKPEEIQNLIDIYNKKKNILNILPKNQYCLVIFKKASYAQYFHHKTSGNLLNNFFCPESYCSFELSGQGIDIYSSIFPNEINWQQLHESSCERIQYSLCTLTINFIVIIFGVAFQFGSIFLRYNNIINHTYEELYTAVSALLINLIVLFANKILHRFCEKQVHPYYSRQKKSFIFQVLLSNIVILTIAPLCISYLIDSAIVYNTNGFISNQLFTLLFYAIFSILNIYMFSSQTKEEVSGLTLTHQHKIDYLLTSHFTVLSIVYFLAPLYPIAVPFGFTWFVAIYLIERYNIAHFYSINQPHGIKLISSMLKYFRRLSFLFLLSISFIYFFASSKFSYKWPLSTIILLSLLLTIFLFFQLFNFGPQLAKIPLPFNQKEPLLNKGTSEFYSKAKENFLMLFETFNFAISYTLKQNKRSNSYSARIKIYEEMNTMSKTLSLSLKERLFNNLVPIMNNEKRMQRGQDHDEMYFEYQKKIHMNKMAPKVVIPPLFKKQEPAQPAPKVDDMEMMNFNSIFSSDDKQARKALKKHILHKLNSNVANQ